MLFRQEMLDRINNPDQLDRLIQVTRPLNWLALGLGVGLTVAALVWSAFSTAPVSVKAAGLFMRPEGVLDVVASGSGRLDRLLVPIGAQVAEGQAIAVQAQPERLAEVTRRRAELAGLRQHGEQLAALHADAERIESRLRAEQMAALTQRTTLLDQRRRATTDPRIQAELEDKLAAAAETEIEIRLLAADRASRREREQLESVLRIGEAERRLAEAEAGLRDALEIRAPLAGTLVELTANVGEIVTAGQPVARLLPGSRSDDLVAVVFVPPAEGKKIQAGMDVQLLPSNAKRERHGYMPGTVVRVAEIPASRESLRRLLKNDTLVQQLAAAGAPFEVRVALVPDAASPSGYRWQSGKGTGAPVEPGTLANAQMVVDRVPLLSLLFPAIGTLWSGR